MMAKAGHLAAGTGKLDYARYVSLLCGLPFDVPITLHGLSEDQVDASVAMLRRHAQSQSGEVSAAWRSLVRNSDAAARRSTRTGVAHYDALDMNNGIACARLGRFPMIRAALARSKGDDTATRGSTMTNDQLQQDGLTGPYELADKSGLDRACEVVLELKALQRQQNRVASITGIENVAPNPLIDRHMDVSAIRDVFFRRQPAVRVVGAFRQ